MVRPHVAQVINQVFPLFQQLTFFKMSPIRSRETCFTSIPFALTRIPALPEQFLFSYRSHYQLCFTKLRITKFNYRDEAWERGFLSSPQARGDFL